MDIEKTIDNTINLLIHIDDKNKTESLFDIGMNFYLISKFFKNYLDINLIKIYLVSENYHTIIHKLNQLKQFYYDQKDKYKI